MKSWIARALIMGLVLGASTGCKEHSGGKKEEHKGKATPTATPAAAPEIEMAKVTLRSIPIQFDMSGTVTANDPVSVSPQLSARVTSVTVDEGTAVAQGQTLMTLDDSDVRIQTLQDQATLQQDYAKLGLQPGQSLKDPNTVPAVKKTLAVLDNQKQNYERYVDLRKQELVADADVANAKQSYKTAQDDYESALEQVQQDQASIAITQAKIEKDKQQMGYTVLRSPITGIIQEKKISQGDLAQTGSAAFLIVDTRDLFLSVAVQEDYVPQIAIGKVFHGTTQTVPPIRVTGKIQQINPILDPATRTLTAKAAVILASPSLRPGMFVRVKFDTGQVDRDLLLPQGGVLTQAGVSHVFVLTPKGKKWLVHDHIVTLGDPEGEWIEVTGNIKEGDLVAASNIAALKDGLEVTAGRSQTAPEFKHESR